MAKTPVKKKAGRPTKDLRKTVEDPSSSRDPDFIPLRESSSFGSEVEQIRRQIQEAGGKRIVEEDLQDGEETWGGEEEDVVEETGEERQEAEAAKELEERRKR